MEANPTLDQLSIFAAVVDCGGFSAAARQLKRSQSVVSYAIANLEDQLQVKLFERHGTRQPRLTEAGAALLMDARRVLSGLDRLRARTRALQQGLEAEIVVAVDPRPFVTFAFVVKAINTSLVTCLRRVETSTRSSQPTMRRR